MVRTLGGPSSLTDKIRGPRSSSKSASLRIEEQTSLALSRSLKSSDERTAAKICGKKLGSRREGIVENVAGMKVEGFWRKRAVVNVDLLASTSQVR